MVGVQRRFDQFLANPASIRNAVGAIVSFTVVAVVLGAAVVRVLDGTEYPTYGTALWFTLQTVTTVGYGDVAPSEPVGRVVAAIVMLSSIALITVVTAAVTSTFVSAGQRRDAHIPSDVGDSELRTSVEGLATRLERIESTLNLMSSQRPEPDASADDRVR